jgi:hypothetical protein
MKTNEIKSKMLNDEQAMVVRAMIIDSLQGVWVNDGVIPQDAFIQAASGIAEKIIRNVQMSLLQSSSFDKAVRNSEPLKKSKKVIKKVTKIKKHGRK